MRGVEAPFQLLIAVFTMIMVMTLAFYVYQRVQRQHCEDQWQKDLGALALKMQSVAGGGAGSKASVRLHLRCGDSGKHVIHLDLFTGEKAIDKYMCRRICQHDPPCVVITDVVYCAKRPNEVKTTIRECVDISPYTYYQISDPTSGCLSADDEYVGNKVETPSGWTVTQPFVDLYIYRPSNSSISLCMRKWGG